MDRTFWHKQTAGQPLFPDLLWSRPENKSQSGKMLIVGGNAHGFAAAAEAYTEAVKAGIGTARVLLPDSLQKAVGRVFEAGEYALSTPSGSFRQTALAGMLAMSEWADGVLLAGDFGRNSETSILLEKFITKYIGQLTLVNDAVDYFIKAPQAVLSRSNTLLVLEFAQLQKIAVNARFSAAFTSNMDFLRIIDTLHEFTALYQASVIIKYVDTIFVAVKGQVSTTKLQPPPGTWRTKTASQGSTWWLQNPAKKFEAITASLI